MFANVRSYFKCLSVLILCTSSVLCRGTEKIRLTREVTGWGQTIEGREPSEELKQLSVPVIPYEQCYEQVPRSFKKFITHDKVCAGVLQRGTAICQGDGGGGLTFANVNYRYYIRGVVSTSPATINKTCNSNQTSTYTLLSKHIDFIRQYVM